MAHTVFALADINNLMVLSYTLDEFNYFNSDLSKLVSSKSKDKIIHILQKLDSKSEFDLFALKNEKKFYDEYEKVINLINRYSTIDNFIDCSYNPQGNLTEDFKIFYHYMLDNKLKIRRIQKLLFSLKTLGFKKIIFSENFDFTNQEYLMFTSFRNNVNITYLDNIKVIPNYNSDIVMYKSTKSNYKIVSNLSYNSLDTNNSTIEVNSLLFNPYRLPNDITKKSLFGQISSLKIKLEEDCNILRNSVNLNVRINRLYDEFNSLKELIKNISDLKLKEQLCQALLEIRDSLNNLKVINEEYDNNLLKRNTISSKELEQEQKKYYLKKNSFNNRK